MSGTVSSNVKVIGAIGVALDTVGSGIEASQLLSSNLAGAAAGVVVAIVGAGLTAAYVFLTTH